VINGNACCQYRGPLWMSHLDYCSGRRLREAARGKKIIEGGSH
jgi:hypothetical protein